MNILLIYRKYELVWANPKMLDVVHFDDTLDADGQRSCYAETPTFQLRLLDDSGQQLGSIILADERVERINRAWALRHFMPEPTNVPDLTPIADEAIAWVCAVPEVGNAFDTATRVRLRQVDLWRSDGNDAFGYDT